MGCLFDEYGHSVPGLIDAEIQHVHIPWSEGWWLLARSITWDSEHSRSPSLGRHHIERPAIGRPGRRGHNVLIGRVTVRPIRAAAFIFARQAASRPLSCIDGNSIKIGMIARTNLQLC